MFLDNPRFRIQVLHRISDINPNDWDRLSGERPFQSYRWYKYGEQVMSDCQPTYILLYHQDELVARASLWLARNEPLPKMPFLARKALTALFRYWPLLICKSPLVFTGGLIVASHEDQKELISALSNAALSIARQQGASFLLFDYLSKADAQNLSPFFNVMAAPNPGTIMENKWSSLEEYLACGNKKDRQHYKRVARESEKLGIKITRHTHVERIDDALGLIRNVERAHGALPNPWAHPMLEHMGMVNGTFLTATLDEQLVGCGLLFEDTNTQITSLLGLAENTSYVYFMLVYESLKIAFERNVRLLRWGSGAYDIKQRLGFSLEDNDSLAFSAVGPLLRKALRWSN